MFVYCRGYGDSYSPTGAINYVAQFLVQDIKEVVSFVDFTLFPHYAQ